MKKIFKFPNAIPRTFYLFVLFFLFTGIKTAFSQTSIKETYTMVSLDGLSDTRQAIAGHPVETEYDLNLSCTDSKNKTQQIQLIFSEKDTREIVQIKPYTSAIYIYLPLKEYDSFYKKIEQIFIKKELRGAIQISIISGTNHATFYYYLLK